MFFLETLRKGNQKYAPISFCQWLQQVSSRFVRHQDGICRDDAFDYHITKRNGQNMTLQPPLPWALRKDIRPRLLLLLFSLLMVHLHHPPLNAHHLPLLPTGFSSDHPTARVTDRSSPRFQSETRLLEEPCICLFGLWPWDYPHSAFLWQTQYQL